MPSFILIDEIMVSLRAPPGLAESQYQAMRRAFWQPRFLTRVRQVVRDVLRRYPSLNGIRVGVSR